MGPQEQFQRSDNSKNWSFRSDVELILLFFTAPVTLELLKPTLWLLNTLFVFEGLFCPGGLKGLNWRGEDRGLAISLGSSPTWAVRWDTGQTRWRLLKLVLPQNRLTDDWRTWDEHRRHFIDVAWSTVQFKIMPKRDKYYLCREKNLEVLFYGIFNDNWIPRPKTTQIIFLDHSFGDFHRVK